MRLFSPGRERRLRRAVRTQLRASPALAKEARQRRRKLSLNQNVRLPPDLLRLTATAWLLILLSGVNVGRVTLSYKLTLLSLWGLALAFTQAVFLFHCLARHPHRTPLLFLPILDHTIFRHQWDLFLARSRGVWIDFAAGYGLILYALEPAPWRWALLPIVATAHWLVTVALAVILLASPGIAARLGLVLVPLLAASFVGLMIEPAHVGRALAGWFDGASDWLLLLLPTGWPAMLFQDVGLGRQGLSLVLLAPLGGLLWASRHRWEKLRASFSLAEVVPDHPVTGLEGRHEALPDLLSQLDLPGATHTLDRMAQRDFLQPPFSWAQAGWLERQVLRWLNPRERVLLEAVLDGLPAWTRGWLRAARCLAIGAVAAATAQHWGASWFGWLDAACLFLGLVLALGTGLPSGGAILSAFPVGFDDLLRLKTKVRALRWASAAPLFLVYGLVLGWRLDTPWPLALALCLKGWCLMPALYPYAWNETSSPGEGVSQDLRLKGMGPLLVGVVCGIATLLLGLAAILPEFHRSGAWLSWLAVPLASAPGWILVAFHRWRFNRCRTDLIG